MCINYCTFMNSTLESNGLSNLNRSRKFSSIGKSWASCGTQYRLINHPEYVYRGIRAPRSPEQRSCDSVHNINIIIHYYFADVNFPVLIIVVGLHETLLELHQHSIRNRLQSQVVYLRLTRVFSTEMRSLVW